MRIARHNLAIPFLPDTAKGLRVAHLTDLHRDPLTRDGTIRSAIRTVNAEKPDLIVMTGDYVSHRKQDVTPVAEMVGELHAPLGTWGILGNHDFRAGGALVRSAMAKAGVQLLHDEIAILDCGLTLVGATDGIEGDGRPGQAMKLVPDSSAVLALIHNPADAEGFSDRPCAALAGHTHGGQVIAPYLTAMKIRAIHAKHYWHGFYQVGNVNLYVNRGIGNVGVPFRFLAPPEVGIFTLE